MGKIATYILIMSGLSILFYLTGLIPNNPLLQLLLDPQSMSTSAFYTTILVAIGTTFTAIAIGFITKNYELAAMTLFVPYLAVLLWNFISVYNKFASVNRPIALLIFAPFILLFAISLVDYWRGRD